MFDKYKERWAKLEEDHESIRKAKQHVEKYQVVYAAVGGSFATLLVVRTFGKPQIIMKEAAPILAPVFNNNNMPVMKNVVENTVNNAGYCAKIVEEVGTDKMWPKAKVLAEQLAEEYGVPFQTARRRLSANINGHEAHAFGRQFRTVGIRTTG